ncbi:Claudin domain-containing protein 1-like protein [Leptotrombidium deliense]|uniref:Claudin domain-containing protein 1-like protein n=1 Tax=Leptotrombidium deliense TaxID=299467 RepID=A0A443SQZ1_9ACAR|nr:Claudin domain-containing protein 1-like protein [Leptotrombidium deliense]
MACSAVTLSIATIISVVAVACLAIAFSTDNWYEIRVNRNKTQERLFTESGEIPTAFDTDLLYFSRDEGLFRVCFPEKSPKDLLTYTSPTQTQCININYYIPEDDVSDKFSDQRWERLRKHLLIIVTNMARSVIALYVVAFFFLFLSFFTGIAGCWKRSHANLVATGILQLLAALMDAGAMGLWHAVQFYDQHKLTDEKSYEAWPEVLKQEGITEYIYGWSYILAWFGVGQCLTSAIMFLCSARCIRSEKRAEQAKNMQYLMPVYPDKRNPYGYAYAYPGPYAYHHGSQYGIGPYGY